MATIDFQAKVIERSFEKPVVVDFWAAWCGPCQTLGPIITEMADAAGDSWELVKVDTEANQELARQYQVMSIPNVKMFYKGEVVAEFQGALPKSQIQKWLDTHLPSAEKAQLQALLEAARDSYTEASVGAFRAFALTQTAMQEAQIFRWWFESIHTPQDALAWVKSQPKVATYADSYDDIEALATLCSIELPAEGAFGEAMRAAVLALQNYDLETGMKQLVQAVMLNKKYHQELPRRAMIALFHLFGEQHPMSKKFRPHFNMALY